jgi:hypothetical protein
VQNDKPLSLLTIPLVNYITWEKAEIKRFQAERFVFTIQAKDNRYKVFQVFFGKSDGSLYINFPYFSINHGIASLATVPAFLHQADISLEHFGQVTSKRVKYAHHPDGQVHFSQTGKVSSSISKKSLPLADAEGHLFTLHLQGLHYFETADPAKDGLSPQLKRTVLNFEFKEEPEAVKVVGRWYKAKTLMKGAQGRIHGPQTLTQTPDDRIRSAFLLGPPKGWLWERYALVITCEKIAQLDQDQEALLNFIAGFDPPNRIQDLSKPSSLLCVSYPVSSYEELVERIGSIDLVEAE